MQPPPSNTIVFVLGGGTYEEARELSQLQNVTFGSTLMVNSSMFLEGVSQMAVFKRNEEMIKFEIE